MNASLRKYRVWIGLLVAVLATWWVSNMDEDVPQKKPAARGTAANARKAPRTAGPQRDPGEALALIAQGFAPRETMSKLHRDPFTVVSFEPPPPPPLPPPKTTAPALNFKYLGLLREDADSRDPGSKEKAVFLDSGGQLLIARKGDTLAGQYRVIEINDNNMQLEYTPLAERQTLNFGR